METGQAAMWMALAVAALPAFPLIFAKRWGQAAVFGVTGVLLAVYYGYSRDYNAAYAWFLVVFTGWIAAIIADQADAREDREKRRHFELLQEIRNAAARAGDRT